MVLFLGLWFFRLNRKHSKRLSSVSLDNHSNCSDPTIHQKTYHQKDEVRIPKEGDAQLVTLVVHKGQIVEEVYEKTNGARFRVKTKRNI